jgi:GT2 family glycosyltransferase
MLPTSVLRAVGYFSEVFGFYGIDPDLTAKVLYSGHDVVYTRGVAINHYREWSTDRSSPEYQALKTHHEKFRQLYHTKYGNFGRWDIDWHIKRGAWWLFRKALGKHYTIHSRRKVFGLIVRDWSNMLAGRHISLFDGLHHRGKLYHLRQHAGFFARTGKVLDDSCLLPLIEDEAPHAKTDSGW